MLGRRRPGAVIGVVVAGLVGIIITGVAGIVLPRPVRLYQKVIVGAHSTGTIGREPPLLHGQGGVARGVVRPLIEIYCRGVAGGLNSLKFSVLEESIQNSGNRFGVVEIHCGGDGVG